MPGGGADRRSVIARVTAGAITRRVMLQCLRYCSRPALISSGDNNSTGTALACQMLRE